MPAARLGMTGIAAAAVAAIALASVSFPARPAHGQSQSAVEAVMKGSFSAATPDWQARLVQDETQKACSRYRNAPPKAIADAIVARERARIKYPADGKLMGDWRKGEKLAQSGYGWRFTDYPPRRANGGNCYACHQLGARELSFGTLGPSLAAYGKAHGYAEAEVKAVYDRIYDPQATIACASMPRLGASGFLTIDQIKDLVAYVMSPDSPVNK
jgi:sulfur-oxidizing protein SoxX